VADSRAAIRYNPAMRIYLVGGAVRDELLGLPVRERDWVVVGATPEQMVAQGYRPVGKDFPVFLHPQTAEEYALARTERKTGPGYHGFSTRFSPDVTLAEDLSRRDLTINAIARDPDSGELIDPYGGARDLDARVLRHVSPAFVEDPLRVLRVARFAARFASLGFRVADETASLLKQMSAGGELATLVAERVWQETQKALMTQSPAQYFRVLRETGALAVVFPELNALFGVPQPAQWHPEIDTGVHVLMVLEQATALSTDPVVRFAALTHDLGKGQTPADQWPRHVGHEARSVTCVDAVCDRLKVPNDYRELARHVARHHGVVHNAQQLRAGTLLDLLETLDAFRRPERFESFLLACMADMRGRTGFEQRPYPQADYLRSVRSAAAGVSLDRSQFAGLTGAEIGERVRRARLAAIEAAKAAGVSDTETG
jgi:tRNA nucleotidyltransferase (CCA-adding enzyme)